MSKSFNVKPGKELEYYQNNFKVQLDQTKSGEDEILDAKEQTDDDRVLDLLLVMDCTGSMGSWIELCKKTLCECVDAVVADHQELDIRVAFVGYRDFCDQDIFAMRDFTLDTQKVKEFIGKQQASGGGDAPEDVQGGLFQGLNLNWRENSIKMCYLCADAPGHGKQYNGGQSDDYADGSPVGLDFETIMHDYSDREIDFTVYSLASATDTMYDLMEQAYNQGKNANQFKRIALQNEISAAVSAGESLGGEIMTSAYMASTSADMKSRAVNHYMRKGW